MSIDGANLEMAGYTLDLDIIGVAPRPDRVDRGGGVTVKGHAAIEHVGVREILFLERRLDRRKQPQHLFFGRKPPSLVGGSDQDGRVHRHAPVIEHLARITVRIPTGGDPSRDILLEKPILNGLKADIGLLIDHLSSLRSKLITRSFPRTAPPPRPPQPPPSGAGQTEVRYPGAACSIPRAGQASVTIRRIAHKITSVGGRDRSS